MKLLRAELGNLREKAGVWSQLKKQGRAAIGALAADFDKIAEIMVRHGVIVNPTGELEASMIAYGVPYTSNKRKWFRDAMAKVHSLPMDPAVQPWKLVKDAQVRIDSI